MAGGQGTRFWPLSREQRPKQFLAVAGAGTMLQQTVERLSPLLSFEDCCIVCGSGYEPLVKSQLEGVTDGQIIVEPAARSTAPAIGLAAAYLQDRCGDETMLVLPADHVIRRVETFHRAVRAAERLALEGWLVTFGIEPTYPATGYGYIQAGPPIRCVDEFLALKAERFLKEGGYFWNSGMFCWSSSRILEEIRRHMPELGQGLAEISKDWQDRGKAAEIFSRMEKVSVDVGVMERSRRIAVLPCRLGWSDVGSWKALEQVCEADEKGVVANGPLLNSDSRDCIVQTSGGKLVVLLGVENLIVVEAPDALLVCDKERAEEVKDVVESLRAKGWTKYI